MNRETIKSWLIFFGPFLGLTLVFMLFSILAPEQFRNFYNIKTIATQTVIVGIGALGMTLVIVSGGIDLSVGSQIALATVVTACVLKYTGGDAETIGLGYSLLGALCGISICAFCGFFNGLLSSYLKIVPFIVTLGMMQIARGVANWLAKQQTVTTPINSLENLMYVDPEPAYLIFAPGVWIMILLLIGLVMVLRYTIFGRHVFAIGSNEKTARLCGVNVRWRRILIYSVCGAFTGIAGVMQFANLTVGDPTVAEGMELDIIAAVVIGGGSLNGGEGSAVGSFVGALIMAVLRNGCTMLGVPNYVQNIIIGVIIIGAVGLDRLKQRFSQSSV